MLHVEVDASAIGTDSVRAKSGVEVVATVGQALRIPAVNESELLKIRPLCEQCAYSIAADSDEQDVEQGRGQGYQLG